MKNLIIIGARGFGRVVYATAKARMEMDHDFVIKGFLDSDSTALDGKAGYPPILSSVEDYVVQENDVFVCALGSPDYKKKYTDIIKTKGGTFYNLIHPTAFVGDNSSIGEGCILNYCSYVCQDCKIGDFVVLDGLATVGHDSAVGNYSHIGAHAFCAGFSMIGNGVTIHPGSSIIPHRKIGDYSVVGIGSVVIKNVKPNTTVFGNPAKAI